MDSFCCEGSWDHTCVAQVGLLGCGDCGSQKRPCCSAGFVGGCEDAAVEACVCASDAFCCDEIWDSMCVEASVMLGCQTCPDAGDGDCCAAGDTPGCDDDGIEFCVCESDPTCCSGPWSQACVDAVVTQGCGICFAEGPCCEPQTGPGCADAMVRDCVCATDPFCCTATWDEQCVAQIAELACGAC